jgi:hypothetical protein
VTPSNGKEAASDAAIHSAKDGTKGVKKRRKQHPQGGTTMKDLDDGSYGKAGGPNVGHVTTAMHGDKR